MTTELTTLSGVVTQLNCDKPTFCAGKLVNNGRYVSFSVKGLVKVNEPCTLRGSWEEHPRWGRQFKGTEVVYTIPADAEGIVAWLAANVQGIGPVKARQLVDMFGEDLPRLLLQDPERVAIEGRLPIEFVRRVAEQWHAAADKSNTCATLAGWGLTQHEVEKVYARFKGSAIAVLQDDPYILVGLIPGFGWVRVDQIGRKLGVPLDHPGRLRAAVASVVQDALDEGSTCCSREGVIGSATDKVGATIDRAQLETAITEAVERNYLVALGDDALAGSKQHYVEAYLGRRFLQGADPNPCFPFAADLIGRCVEAMRTLNYRGTSAELDDSQMEAVRTFATHRFCVVTGGAGAGKTLVAKAICDLALRFGEAHQDASESDWAESESDDELDEPQDKPKRLQSCAVALCAPTGKAARRLTEVVGREATTVHRLLGFNPETGGFLHNGEFPLPYDLVIVDESSMLDAGLTGDLFRAVGPNTAVVLIGDDNQLPPVGPGYPLRDILEHKLIPFQRLAKCHRQAGALKHNSVRVLQGVVEPSVIDQGDPGPWLVHRALETPERILATIQRMAEDLFPKWNFVGLMDWQFVTAKHEGQLGTKKINELLQRVHQKSRGVDLPERASDESLPLLLGDKVIHTKNNYNLNVMNGTVGTVVSEDPLAIEYDGKRVAYPKDTRGEVSLAYCLTVHKMQGSEVPCVVVICPKSHAFMQHRNWLYTGVTRAKQTAIVIGAFL